MHWRSSYLIGGELELAEKYSDELREMLADTKETSPLLERMLAIG